MNISPEVSTSVTILITRISLPMAGLFIAKLSARLKDLLLVFSKIASFREESIIVTEELIRMIVQHIIHTYNALYNRTKYSEDISCFSKFMQLKVQSLMAHSLGKTPYCS